MEPAEMFDRQMRRLRRASKIVQDTAGTSTAEYAVLLSLVLVMGVAGFFGLSSFTHWVFRQSEELTYVAHDARNPLSQDTTTSSEAPDKVRNRLIEKVLIVLSKAESAIQFAAGVVGLLLGVSLVIGCWQILHSHHRKRADEASSVPGRKPPSPRHELLYAKRAVLRRVLRRALDREQAAELPVAKLMSEELVAVHPKTVVHKIVERIREKGVSHVLVIDHNGELLGIISHRDLSRRTGRYAEDVMTREPLRVDVSASASQAVSLMLEQDISCLPVVHEGRVCGVFTKTDVMIGFQALVQALELLFASPAGEEGTDELSDSDEAIPEELATDDPNTLASGV